jgi:hypothetical protein
VLGLLVRLGKICVTFQVIEWDVNLNVVFFYVLYLFVVGVGRFRQMNV